LETAKKELMREKTKRTPARILRSSYWKPVKVVARTTKIVQIHNKYMMTAKIFPMNKLLFAN
jgi:hypothetical protein